MIVDYIDVHRHRFGVEPICEVLSEHDMPIAPSTYFARKACPVSRADWDDAHLANAALDVWRANRSVYGADKWRPRCERPATTSAVTRWPG